LRSGLKRLLFVLEPHRSNDTIAYAGGKKIAKKNDALALHEQV